MVLKVVEDYVLQAMGFNAQSMCGRGIEAIPVPKRIECHFTP